MRFRNNYRKANNLETQIRSNLSMRNMDNLIKNNNNNNSISMSYNK